MASPIHCLVCDCSAKSQQRLTPSAYGWQSIWMAEQEDVADTLPTEGSQYAIQEDLLVDHVFLQQLKHQRDMHSKQLRAPVFVPNPSLPSRVSHTHHRPLTIIPVLRPCKRVVRFSRLIRHSLSCYLRLQISGLHKKTISQCRTGLLITVLRLLDSNQT